MTARRLPLFFAFLLAANRVWAQAGNDDFALRIPLAGGSVTAVSNLRTATRETGEPNHAYNGGTRSLWWTWTAPATGTINLSTFGGGATPGRALSRAYTRALAVYTGDSLTSLSEVASAGTLGAYPQTGNVPAGPSCNVPVVAGTTYQIAVDGPAILDGADDGTVVLAVNQVPTIYSAAGASGAAGGAFTYTILAGNNPTGFGATDLPAGLSVNPSTGDITGTLPAAGTYAIRLAATNPGGTGTATLTLVVSNPSAAPPTAPVCANSAAAVGCVGVTFSYSINAGGAVTYAADGLPPGVTLDATTGSLYGTPTTAGLYSVALTATNAAGTGTATVAVNIAAAPVRPVINSALSVAGTVGNSLSYGIAVADTSTAGKPTAYTAANLPPGLGFDPGTGVLQGVPTQAGTWSVPVSASNAGGTGRAVLTVIAAPVASAAAAPGPPVLTSAAAVTGSVGTAFSYRLAASNTPTSFAADSLPPGLSLNGVSGFLTGTPTAAGVYRLPVGATNDYGATRATLTVNVLAAATTGSLLPPVVIISPAEAVGYVGSSLSYQVIGAAWSPTFLYPYYPVGSASATYAASGLPPGMIISPSLGGITGTPTTAGTYAATVTVTPVGYSFPQASAGSATVTFVISSGSAPGVSAAPVFTSQAGIALNTATTYSSIVFAEASNNPTSFAASSLPAGLTVDTSNGSLSGRPTTTGTYRVPVTATNAAGTGTATLTISVTPPAAAPAPGLASDASAAGTVGATFTYSIATDNGATSYSAGSLPPGLSLSTKTISGTPTQAGVFAVPISATNAGGTTTGTLTITVASAPGVPIINSDATARGTPGYYVSYSISATNLPTSYTAANLPPGLSLGGGTISGTATQAGVWTVPVTATNATGTGTANVTFTIIGPSAPTFSCAAAATATVGSAFSYNLYAISLVTGYTAANLPPGLSLGASGGTISGTPTQAGVFRVPVTATNGGGTTAATLTITVGGPASPTLTSASLEVTATLGTPANVYRIPVTGGATSFGASGLPPGLSLDAVSGAISGTPTAAGVYQTTISVANGSGSASAVIDIAVADPVTTPVFNVFAAGVAGTVGTSFAQTLFASGGGTMTYAASGLPPGLSLNARTGRLAGTPTAAGTYSATLSASNATGSDNAGLNFVVADVPARPVFYYDPLAASGSVGASLSVSVSIRNDAACTVGGLPPGLNYTYGSGGVFLRGTPTAAGTYPVTFTATNAAGSSSVVMKLFIAPGPPAAPVIFSAAGASGTVGAPFAYSVASTISYGYGMPVSYGASGLPDGLQFNAVTGAITGAPTTAGTYPVTITATNAGGVGSGIVTVGIGAAPSAAGAAPVIGSAASAYFTYGTVQSNPAVTLPTFTYTITASNTPASFAATGLPPGLTLNPATGMISGRPLASGNFFVPISATNAAGTGRATLKIMAPASPPALALPLVLGGTAGGGLTYAANANSSDYSSGAVTAEPTTFAASGLPPGLSFNTATGVIAGAPSQAGTFATTITATDRAGTTSGVVTFVIAAGPVAPVTGSAPVLTGAATVGGFVGAPVNTYLYGGASYASGSLPAGLVLNPASGAITGTPTTAGTYAVPVTASNAFGTGGATLTFDIAAAPPAPPLIASAAGARATVGSGFVYVISTRTAAGTVYPATGYGASGLPPGLSLNGASGFLSGTPTQAGTFTIPISATAGGATANATLTLSVLPASPALATVVSGGPAGTLGFVGRPFNLALGTAGLNADGALPAGLTYDAATGTLGGLPTAAGSFDLSFSTGGAGGRSALNLRVVAPDLSLPQIVTQPAGATVAQGGGISLGAAVSGAPAPTSQWTRDGVAVPGATDAVLRLDAAQPADAGTYVLTAVNSSGRAVSAGALLVVTQTYGDWQAANFSRAEIAAGLAAGGYDFDGDGLPNLLEYALGRDPRTGQGGGVPIGTRPAAGALQLRFPRDTGKTDIVYTVEASADLLNWTAIARSTAGGVTTNLGGAGSVSEGAPVGGVATVTVIDGQGAGPSRFLRLRVERP